MEYTARMRFMSVLAKPGLETRPLALVSYLHELGVRHHEI